MKEHIYHVKGMHCASCEVLIEKKLLELPGITAVDASTNNGKVAVTYEASLPDNDALNGLFRKEGYVFSAEQRQEATGGKPANKTLVAFNIAICVVIGFLLLERVGLSGFLNVSSRSSLPAFFLFGVLASLSSCAALVGGLILSMSQQWHELYRGERTVFGRLQPHLLFTIGRVLSYAFLGGLLGLVGSRLQLSLPVTSFLIIAVSLVMMAMGLQMVGVKAFRKFPPALPRSATRYIANEKNFHGRYMPFLMGAATFFLPCGFTITAQSLALLSGNALQGGMIMGAFALGTSPMLLGIGLSSITFLKEPRIALTFSKVAGFLLLFFALFTMGSQFNLAGLSAGIPGQRTVQVGDTNELAPLFDGKQVIKMTVYANNYTPAYFKVKAGIPVAWEVTSSGQPGCDSGAIVSQGLLPNPMYLNPNAGALTVQEFTPTAPGTYAFSCTMGMVKGTIEVVN